MIVYQPGHWVPHGDAIARLIQLYSVPEHERDDDWATEEKTIRDLLNDRQSTHRGPQQLTLEDL
ncbi:MAG TPA: hypothetical protein VMV78_01250 [Thiobacillus sp.]|nr:hypothetical protein [Thiobacillus sp.]